MELGDREVMSPRSQLLRIGRSSTNPSCRELTDHLVDVLEGVNQILGAAKIQAATMWAPEDPSDLQIAGLRFEKLLATRAFESDLSRSHALVLSHQRPPICRVMVVFQCCFLSRATHRIKRRKVGIFA